jgi:hypothetical protein
MVEMRVDLGEIFGDKVVREGIYCGNVEKLLGGGHRDRFQYIISGAFKKDNEEASIEILIC